MRVSTATPPARCRFDFCHHLPREPRQPALGHAWHVQQARQPCKQGVERTQVTLRNSHMNEARAPDYAPMPTVSR